MRPALRILGTHHPRLLELDVRAWLARLSQAQGRVVRLNDVRESDLEPISSLGIDAVWLMGVWRPGSVGRRLWRQSEWLTTRARASLPDGSERDIVGSPFAISDYEVATSVGGEDGLMSVRRRLAAQGIALILDFVPNHTAIDHPWVRRNPTWFVQGGPDQIAADPDAFFEVRADGRHFIAHGRDPWFPPWHDTAQLDYRNPNVTAAMARTLLDISNRCDGVRCDMAMLVLDDVFRAMWNSRSLSPPSPDAGAGVGEFWWHAIRTVREAYPHFLMIAEAYWGAEWRLQQLGFDQTYDKTLLDRLVANDGRGVAAHLRADEEYQRHSLRFLESHDEPRIAALLGPEQHRSAALVTAAVPGMLMIHDGQELGLREQPSVQLGRRPPESADGPIAEFYAELLRATHEETFRLGHAVRIEPQLAWLGNSSHESMIVRLWVGPHRSLRLAVANLSDAPSQCYVPLPIPEFAGRTISFEDCLSDATYLRSGDELLTLGLYLDLPAYGRHLFRVMTGRTKSRRRRKARLKSPIQAEDSSDTQPTVGRGTGDLAVIP